MKILVCDPLSEKGIDVLRSISGAEVDEKFGLKEADLKNIVGEYEAMVVRSGVKITQGVLEAAKNLRVVARAGMGYDNIDLDAATKRGVVVMNTPGQNAVTTAEHTIALMMALARNIPQAHAVLTTGKWDRKNFVGMELSGKTLGVVGLGNVGREVAHRARGLKMDVIGFDPFVSEKSAEEMGVLLVPLAQLFATADIISLHSVLNDSTRKMINEKSIASMKDKVRIVNCARGDLIDAVALKAALDTGKIAGAALDVFEKEPPDADDPLLKHPHVVHTPHLGASTDEAQEQVALAAAEQIKAFLIDDMVINGVNVPSVSRDVLKALAPYISLGGKIGRLLGQIGIEKIDEIRVEAAGDITKHDLAPLTAAVLCGLMQKLTSESVNFVSAPVMARERGIRVVESKTNEAADFQSLLTVTLRSSGKEHLVSGSVFGRKVERIVRLDNFYAEFSPSGYVLLIHNEDKPGVVGSWGTILGKHKINISQMQVALDEGSGNALSIVNIDTPVNEQILSELRNVTNIQSVRQVHL